MCVLKYGYNNILIGLQELLDVVNGLGLNFGTLGSAVITFALLLGFQTFLHSYLRLLLLILIHVVIAFLLRDFHTLESVVS